MRLAILALVALFGPAVAASAQSEAQPDPTPLRDLSLEELGGLEVTTVSKQPAEIWRTPAGIAVLTQDDIRRSGLTTLPELLRLIPGVQVSRLDSGHWAIGIRGQTHPFSKSLLVLIDGRSVYTPLFGGVYWQVQDTLIEDIDRIEVIRGPGGTIWGSNAFNGVVNVITKSSRDTLGALATIGAGNVDQGRVGFRYGAAHGEALSYRAYGTGFLRDALHHTDGNDFDDWRMAQAGFRVDVARPGGERFQVQGDTYKGRAGDRVGIASFAPPSRLMLEGSEPVTGVNLLARWERDLGGGRGFRLQGYYDRTARGALVVDETRHTVDVDFIHQTPIGSRHQLSWGAGARNSTSDLTQRYDVVAVSPEDRPQRFASAFAQDEIALRREALWLTLGTKFERNTYTGWETQPSARLLWRPSVRQTLWTSVTKAVRTPSRVETDLKLTAFALPSPPVYLELSGSRDFEAERLVGIEAGYRRLIASKVYVDVTVFHNHYDRLASFKPLVVSVETSPIVHLLFRTAWENAIRGSSDGFEILPDWRPAPWLRFKGAYAFLTINMENVPGHTDAQNVTQYEGWSPRHQGFGQVSLTLDRGVEIDYATRFMSGLRYRDIPGYVTGDARLGWTVAPRLTVALAGQNLFDPNHVEFFHDDTPMVGMRRSVLASVTWRP